MYRFDSKTGASAPFAQPKLSFNPADFTVEQVFYPSKDGTKIPMFVVHKKDLDLTKGAPTLLYSYGGFNISQTPTYSATRMAWLQSGGVFALASETKAALAAFFAARLLADETRAASRFFS